MGTVKTEKRAIKQATMQQLLTGKTRLPGFSGEWETKQLEDIADCLDNVRVPLNETQRANMQGPYPYCGANGVLDYVNDYVLDDDVVLIAEDGGYFDEFLTRPIAYRMSGKIWVNNHAHILKAKSDYDQGFLYYSLVHKNIIPYLSGGTRAKLNKFEMYKIEINVPNDIEEQHAIAEVLSDVDGLINVLDGLIAKKRAIKQATMQQLLTGKTRLPGFSGEWETKRLGEIASFFKGSGLSKADLSPDGKRRCIHYGELFTTYGEYITEVVHGTDRDETFFLSFSNDVLMPGSDVTPNGLATASCISIPDVILGGDVLVIRVPTDIINGTFLAYVIGISHSQVMQLVSGTTVYHLYGRDMANFTFIAPSVEEQDAIVSVLSDMDAEIAALERRRDKTRAIKQGMMQQLLTGRVRLLSESRIDTDYTDDAD